MKIAAAAPDWAARVGADSRFAGARQKMNAMLRRMHDMTGPAGGLALFCLDEVLNYCARGGWRERSFCYICL